MNVNAFSRLPAKIDGVAGGERRLAAEVGPIAIQLLSIFRRRKWLMAGVVSAVLVLGLLITLFMTPKFTATALIEIQRENGSFVKVDGAEQKDNFVDQEFYQTQYGLLQAQSLAERVATDLRLYDNQEFLDRSGVKLDKFSDDGRAKQPAAWRAERVRAAGAALLKSFSVSPVRFSRLVEISYTGYDAALSKRVIDTWGRDFIQMTLERRYEATAYARRFLQTRLDQLRARIDTSERQLVGYAAQQGIVNLPATGGTTGSLSRPGTPASPERSLVADNLANLNQELTQATADRIRAESRLNSPAGAVSEALDNLAITNLRQKRAELSADYAKLMTQFEPDYPPARALKSQIDQLDGAIGREETRVQRTLRQNYDASRSRERSLQEQVTSLKSGLLDFRRRSIQYDILQREVDTNQQLYDALLQRFKEIGVAGGVGVNNISIVDGAEQPRKPSSPKLLLNMALALVIGFVLAGGLALLLEQIDQGISDPSQVEQELGVPLLGSIPKVESGNPTELVRDRKSALHEAYLSLQTNLNFATDHGFPKTLAVTSAMAAEGKSTTTYALAHSLARSRGRVVLVDADMRSPSVHHLTETSNAHGLSNYLAGDDDLARLIQPVPESALSVIAAGPHPPSAPELLASDRFRKLIERLLETFDHVVFDIPPVMGLADAPLIASAVEGVIFVIEANGTSRGTGRVAVSRLVAAHAHLLGAVLTKFDSRRAFYGYGYDYGYGYGEDQSKRAV